MSYQHILVGREDDIVTLTLNHPETRNSMSPDMGAEVVAAVEEIRADPAVRVLVVTGAGKAFCSGGDLGMLARDTGLRESGPTIGSSRDFYGRFLSIRSLSIPTIAAMNGHAIGAGLCFALACDLRVAVADAKMGMTFTRLGIHPGMGATYFLPRLVGTARACELLFTGRVIDAGTAERLGLVNQVVARDAFATAVRGLAAEIAACGPIAVKMVKKSVYRGSAHSLEEMLDFEALQQTMTFQTTDAREGVAAVIEKREPKFEGK
jgi:enoyl-CoA hydratase